jgi:cell division protein FtsW
MKKFFSTKTHAPDLRFIIILGIVIVFGLIMLSSASAPMGYEKFGDSYYLVKHQLLLGVIPGIVLCVFFSLVDYHVWKKFAFGLLIVSIILLISVFIPGIGAEYGTAKSWLYLFGFSLQPSEIVKLTFMLYLATWLSSRGKKKTEDFSEGLIPFVAVLGTIMLLMILQPDLGTMIIIVAMALIMYFIGGAKISHLIGLGALGFGGILVLMKVSPYRTARLMTFLHPELDPQGIGYHINQAFLAIGSGGIGGRGFGMSRQKFQYLPEVAGDSIFAIIAEELGLIFSALVVVAFLYFFLRGLKIAQQAPDNYGKLVVIGVVGWLLVQSFINIGAMVGILPLTGVPLPFISQGGTALAISLAACGIVINVSRQTKV